MLALWLRGMPFTVSAAVGFVALSGVVSNTLLTLEVLPVLHTLMGRSKKQTTIAPGQG